MPAITIRPTAAEDREWIAAFTAEHWGSDQMVTQGKVFSISRLPGFVALIENEVVGLATYHLDGQECELTSLDSLREGMGIGSALIEAVKSAACEKGCTRLFLITTNDNTDALRFYQRRGFVLAELHPGAIEISRKLKPEIPFTGNHGIPIRDEIVLEITLNQA